MSTVLLAAAIWPFVLLALGLLLGRALRRGDQPAGHRPVFAAGAAGTPRPRSSGEAAVATALGGGTHVLAGP
jgi:hypothetical protein